MPVNLTDVDVVTLAFLEHAYLWHYIDFSDKSKFLTKNYPNNPGELDESSQSVTVIPKLLNELQQISHIRDSLFWFLKRQQLLPAELEIIGQAEKDPPMKLGNWSDISKRLFTLSECLSRRMANLKEFGRKLSEYVEAKIIPLLPGMSQSYGDAERKAALEKTCRLIGIDFSTVIDTVDSEDLNDPITLVSNTLRKLQNSMSEDNRQHEINYDIFLSYASADESRAEQIREALERNGLRCFMSSKQLTGGDIWGDIIRNALRMSREVCILFTPRSANSEWVLTEWGAAWALEKRIVPILHC